MLCALQSLLLLAFDVGNAKFAPVEDKCQRCSFQHHDLDLMNGRTSVKQAHVFCGIELIGIKNVLDNSPPINGYVRDEANSPCGVVQ